MNTIYRSVILGIVFFASIAYVYLLGRNILTILGWSACLLPLILVILVFSIKIKKYYEKVLLFVLCLIGFIVFNHVTYFVLSRNITLNLVTMYLFFLPFGLMYIPFSVLIDEPISKSALLPARDKAVSENIRNYFAWIIIGGVYVPVPIVIVISKPQLIPYILFIPSILSLSYLLSILIRIPFSEAEYFLEAMKRTDKKNRVWLYGFTIFCLSLIIPSVLLEYYRGYWLYGLTFATTLSLMILTIFMEYRHMFVPIRPTCEPPRSLQISRLSLGTIFVVGFVYTIIVIIVGLSTGGL